MCVGGGGGWMGGSALTYQLHLKGGDGGVHGARASFVGFALACICTERNVIPASANSATITPAIVLLYAIPAACKWGLRCGGASAVATSIRKIHGFKILQET